MLSDVLYLQVFSEKVTALLVFLWYVLKSPIHNNAKMSSHRWKEAMIPVVRLKMWDSFPHRPLSL